MLTLATTSFPAVRLLNGRGWVHVPSGTVGRPPDGTEFSSTAGAPGGALEFQTAALPQEIAIVGSHAEGRELSDVFRALLQVGYEDALCYGLEAPGALLVRESSFGDRERAPGMLAAVAAATLKVVGGWDETNPIAVMTRGGIWIVWSDWNGVERSATAVSTSLGWRRVMDQLEDGRVTDAPATLVVFDWDSGQAFNDAYGHDHGDLVITRIAGAIASCAARVGVGFARTGGEEFAAVFPAGARARAVGFANEVVTAVRALSIPFEHPSVRTRGKVTVSAGVCAASRADLPVLEKRRDEAIYGMKRRGGDGVNVLEDALTRAIGTES